MKGRDLLKFYCEEIDKVLAETGTSREGLTSAEAEKRLETYGKNKLAEPEKATLLQRFFAQLKDPMLIILLIAAAG